MGARTPCVRCRPTSLAKHGMVLSGCMSSARSLVASSAVLLFSIACLMQARWSNKCCTQQRCGRVQSRLFPVSERGIFIFFIYIHGVRGCQVLGCAVRTY